MYKLNFIAIVSIVAAVSFVVGMTAPAAFAQENMTMNMDNSTMSNMSSSMGNGNMTMNMDNTTMPGMSNATSMTGQ